MIVNCTCEHKYQDETYGKGRRVANKAGKDSNPMKCTVCGKATSKTVYPSKKAAEKGKGKKGK